MKLKLAKIYTISRKKLKLSISEFINEEIEGEIFFKSEYKVFENNIIFMCRIEGGQEFLTQFDGNTFKHINLSSYENQHRERFIREKDEDGNWTDVWTKPSYPENKIDYSYGFNIAYFGEKEFGLLNMYNLYLWENFNSEPIHYRITNKFKTKIRTIKNTGEIKKSDFRIIKTGQSIVLNEISVILSTDRGTQGKDLFSVLKKDTKTKTYFWKFINNEMPINLPLEEYPENIRAKHFNQLPLISDIYWNGKDFTTFTFGTNIRYLKYGCDWQILLKADITGKRTQLIYQPKHMCLGYFPINNRYVIIKPIYKKDGKPYLFDLKTNKPIDDIKMPRGFSKFEIFEVTKNHILAKYNVQNKEIKGSHIIYGD